MPDLAPVMDVGEEGWLEEHVLGICLDIPDSTCGVKQTYHHPGKHSYLFILVLLEAKHVPAFPQLPRNIPFCCHNPALAIDQDILAVWSHSWLVSLSSVRHKVSSDSVGSFWKR